MNYNSCRSGLFAHFQFRAILSEGKWNVKVCGTSGAGINFKFSLETETGQPFWNKGNVLKDKYISQIALEWFCNSVAKKTKQYSFLSLKQL